MYMLLAFILAGTTLVMLALAFVGFARSAGNPGARVFAWLCLCCGMYAGGYFGELSSPDLRTLLYFTRLQYTGLSFIPALIILMSIEFDGRWVKSRLRWLVLTPSTITYMLVLFIDKHEWFYVNPVISTVNGLTVLSLTWGFWYIIQQGYMYLAFAFGIAIFASSISRGSRAKKAQAGYFLAGGLLPLAGNVFYLFIGTPYGLDVAPITFAVTAVFFALGFLRHRAFDLAPLARDAVFDQMRDAIVVVDEKARLADFNRQARDLLPCLDNRSAILGLPVADILAGYPSVARAFAGAQAEELMLSLSTGEERRFEPRISWLEDSRKRNRGRVLTLVDVSERAALEAKLTELAQIDELTGLLNRRYFLELARTELERARRYGRPFGVAIMDLDGFKEINDSWGHAAGDEALCLVARLCKETLRACDLFGRYGGDEFVFAFPECDEVLAEAAAAKLANIISKATLSFGGQLVLLSASIGTAGGIGGTCRELEELLAIADGIMYRKKKAEVKGRKGQSG
jgi:diguanylate cyclase (GGDEF)-like protein